MNGGPAQIGLTLSGGGFRATLFHLGVVRFLSEAGLLQRVRFISGVSGGAILAAHVGLNWKRYAGGDESFTDASREVVEFTQSDVRNRILRRWIVGWALLLPRLVFGWSRTRLLEREYNRLFGDKRLNALPFVYAGHGPRIVLQTASLTTGAPCTFGRSGFMSYEEQGNGRGINLPDDREASVAASAKIALAVAASSAFPPMFPPIRITNRDLGADVSELTHPHYLTDGGVYDNLGIDRPLLFYKHKHPDRNDALDAFLISDAEGSFDWQIKGAWRFKFAVPRNVRATTLLMKRLSRLTWDYLTGLQSHAFVSVNISSSTASSQRRQQERAIKNMRTDLDAFTDLEVESLLKHGYAVTRDALLGVGWIGEDAPDSPWSPVKTSDQDAAAQVDALARSCKRRWSPLFFGFDDPFTWWLLLMLVTLIATVTVAMAL
jgi:predicted acylesterase/phospholipase RssA